MLDINPINRTSSSPEKSGRNHDVYPSAQQDKPQNGFSGGYMKDVPEPEFLETENNSKLIFNFVLIVTFLVIGLAGYLYFAKQTKNEELKTKERVQSELNTQLSTPEISQIDKTASLYSAGLNQLAKLISSPVRYSMLFIELEKIIPNNATLTALNLDEKNNLKLSAQMEKLDTAARFVQAIESSTFFDKTTLDTTQLATTKDNKEYYTVTVSANLKNSALTGGSKESK